MRELEVCRLDEFPPGTVRIVPVDAYPVRVRDDDGVVVVELP